MFTFFKIMTWIWPFIWEAVVGKLTVKEALRTRRKGVAIAVMFIVSVFLNFWFGAKIIAMGNISAVDRRDLDPPAREKLEGPPPIDAPPHQLNNKQTGNSDKRYDRLQFVSKEIETIRSMEERF